jgi:hypothetical protein
MLLRRTIAEEGSVKSIFGVFHAKRRRRTRAASCGVLRLKIKTVKKVRKQREKLKKIDRRD